jgi:hypothetical protein
MSDADIAQLRVRIETLEHSRSAIESELRKLALDILRLSALVNRSSGEVIDGTKEM